MTNPGDREPSGGTADSVSTPPPPTGGAASPSPAPAPTGPGDRPTPSLSTIISDVFVLIDAQMRIWRLQARGRFVAVCLGLAFFLAMGGLGLWGFVLLDEAIRAWLADRLNPWIAGLIRGVVYLGISGVGFYVIYLEASPEDEVLPPDPPHWKA